MALSGNFSTAILSLVEDITSAELANINEAIFEQTWSVGDFANAHSLRTGVRNGAVIPIVLAGDNYCSMPVGNELSCTLNECDNEMEFSAKKYELAEYNCRQKYCLRSLDDQFLAFWNAYRQRLDDPLTTPDHAAFIAFLTQTTMDNTKGAMWRTGYWGDTSAVGVTADLIKGFDGYWAQALAGNGVKQQITKAGTDPTGEELLNAVYSAIESATENLYWFNNANVVIKMGAKAAYTIINYLNRLGLNSPYNCDCVNPDGYVNSTRFSIEGFRILGIPVEVHREIDGSGACVSGNPWQILIAEKSSLIVATNTQDKLEMFDIFFDKKDRNIYVDSMFYMGVSILPENYIYLTTDPITT